MPSACWPNCCSERQRRVLSPTIFWVLSLIASLLFFLYGWLRQDFALMLGQVIGYYAYIWNLWLKGVWRTLGAWRYPVLGVLLLVPVAAMGGMAFDWADVSTTLFHNEAIPRWLLLFGSAGQIIFSLRFLYQAIYSARQRASVLPKGFWYISLTGSAMILIYALFRHDPVVILSQCFGLVVYTRNLILWNRSHNA